LAGTGNKRPWNDYHSSAWVWTGSGYTLDNTSPFSVVNTWSGEFITATPVDLDGDGDLDVVRAGPSPQEGLVAFRNTGTTLEQDDSLLDGDTIRGRPKSVLAFVDLDADGDYDLVMGNGGWDGLGHYENTGNATNPHWTKRFDCHWRKNYYCFEGDSPFVDLLSGGFTDPAFVDLDGDGDFDYVVSSASMQGVYYENVGTPTNAVFERRSGVANPLDAISLAGSGFGYTFKDIDGDGDYDAVTVASGHYGVYLNVGTATSPQFDGAEATDINPFTGLSAPGIYGFDSYDDFYKAPPQFFPSATALPAAAPSPSTPPAGAGGAGASAVGDPHLQNIHGERFDLMKAGKHVLINIPRGMSADNALLRVQADARRLGGHCADMYFQELNVTGSWADAKHLEGTITAYRSVRRSLQNGLLLVRSSSKWFMDVRTVASCT